MDHRTSVVGRNMEQLLVPRVRSGRRGLVGEVLGRRLAFGMAGLV